MKPRRFFTFTARIIAILALIFARSGAAAQVTLPSGEINTGSASFFTVLTKGEAGFPDNRMTDYTRVRGNVGIGAPGDLKMTGRAKIEGDLVYRTGATIEKTGGARIFGTTTENDTLLNQALEDVRTLSNNANSLAANRDRTNVNLGRTEDIKITGSGTVVLSLRNFVLSGHSSFTLEGTAATSFIINVSQKFQLSGASEIKLAGGVTESNVLFNVRGSGSEVSIKNQAKLRGTLLANRQVAVTGDGSVTGRVIAKQVKMKGNGAVVSPSTNL